MNRVVAVIFLCAACLPACGADPESTDRTEPMTMIERSLSDVTAEEWQTLAKRRIFFGHQSVGRNIMAGVHRLVEARPEIGLRVVTTEDPWQVDGSALIDADIGENRYPETKDRAFAAVLENGFGDAPGTVAMYKYCYVDMQPDTDPEQLFHDYAAHIEQLRDRFPDLTIVHFTMPLHRAETGWKEWLKTRLGRPTQTALNIKRNRYNDLLRERYGDTDPVFDLAYIESLRADGTRAYSTYGGQKVYMLAPQWTGDGGHLTEQAQDRVAERLIVFLATLDD